MSQVSLITKKINIQTLLYRPEPGSLNKFLDCLLATDLPPEYRVAWQVGDCSPAPGLDRVTLDGWQRQLAARGVEFHYSFFDENLGFARGHNRLFRQGPECDMLLVLNPDAVFPFHLVNRLVSFAEARPDYGIVEARQIPLEHPKDFNLSTSETGWASGACSLFNRRAFEECSGFDEAFFMYCEDVDLSWRIRAAGYKVYYCPATFIYHAKHITPEGMEASLTEQLYAPVCSMLLRAKYGRADLNEPVLKWLKGENGSLPSRILQLYSAGLKTLTPATRAEQAAAFFSADGNFARHRWQYHSFKAFATVQP